MDLIRQPDGTITLEGLSLKEWYKTNGIEPTQLCYRDDRNGECLMCLLTTLAFVKLGKDATALAGRTGYQRDARVYRKTSQLIAEVLGIEYWDAKSLEAGWSESAIDRSRAEIGGKVMTLWDLGRDAWEQATT